MLTIVFAGSSLSNPNLGDSCVPTARDQVGNGGVQNKTRGSCPRHTEAKALCFFKKKKTRLGLNTDQHFRNSSVQVRFQSGKSLLFPHQSGNATSYVLTLGLKLFCNMPNLVRKVQVSLPACNVLSQQQLWKKKSLIFHNTETQNHLDFLSSRSLILSKPFHYSSLVMCTLYPSLYGQQAALE